MGPYRLPGAHMQALVLGQGVPYSAAHGFGAVHSD